MPQPFLFDKRNPHQLSLEPRSELEQILQHIRSTSDRVAGEDWTAYYERTMLLAHAELARRRRQRRLQASHPSTPKAEGGDLKKSGEA